MEPNYLAYAQAVNAGKPMADGLKQLAATIEARRERERLAPQEAQATSLRNLQIQQAQAGLDESTAERSSLVDLYGTKGQPDEYARAMSFQAQEAKDKEALAAKQKGMETYLNTVKALDGMTTLDAGTKTEISKHFLSQNPEYAEIAKNLNYVDSKGVEATRQFGAGELKDPATGQFLPAGFYKTKGVWTGDAANPVKLISYEAVAPPKTDTTEQPYKLGELKEFQSGRTKTWKEYAGKNQWKDRPDLGSAVVDKPAVPGAGPDAKGDLEERKIALRELPALRKDAESAKQAYPRINRMLQIIDSGNAGGVSSTLKQWLAPYAPESKDMNEAALFQTFARMVSGPQRVNIIGTGPQTEAEGRLLATVGGGGTQGRAALRELLNMHKEGYIAKRDEYNQMLSNAKTKIYQPINFGDSAAPAAPTTTGGKDKRPPLSAIFGNKR